MARKNGIFKKYNGYQKLIGSAVYEKTPKAVFAALFVSYLLNGRGASMETIDSEILHEWQLLYNQEIVPQRPPKK